MYDDYEVTVGLPCVPKQDKTRSIYRWLEDLPDSPRKYFVIGMDPWKSPVRFEDQYDYAVNGPGSSGGFYSGHYSDYYQNICDGYGWSYESCERGSSVEYSEHNTSVGHSTHARYMKYNRYGKYVETKPYNW